MAYVAKVNDYRYEVREKVAVGEDDAGKTKYVGKMIKSFHTRVEADAYVANFRLKTSIGEKVKASQGKIPFEDALRAYIFKMLEEKYDEKDPAIYRLKSFLKIEYKWLYLKELGTIDYEDMNTYIEYREDGDLAPSTINRELNTLSPFFNWCKKQYKIKHWENPVADSDRPKVDDRRDRTLDDEESSKILKACKESGSEMLEYAFILAMETAIRRGELCQVKWSDVVLDGDKSHINLRKECTKTKQARTVPLSKLAQEAIKNIQDWQTKRKSREEQLKKRREAENMFNFEYMLSGVTSTAIGQAFRRAVKESCVEDFRFHDCRHCAATNLATTFEMLELSQITGHSDPRMLKRYYNPHGSRLAEKLNKQS